MDIIVPSAVVCVAVCWSAVGPLHMEPLDMLEFPHLDKGCITVTL